MTKNEIENKKNKCFPGLEKNEIDWKVFSFTSEEKTFSEISTFELFPSMLNVFIVIIFYFFSSFFFSACGLEYSNRFNSSLYEFLNYYEEKKEKLSIVSPSETNAVELMTIHKSKGLEFPIVIYPYADLDIYKEIEPKEWFPIKDEKISNFSHLLMSFNKDVEHYNSDGKSIFNLHKSKQEIDNINLLYVTLTRAKNELYIIGSQCLDKNGQENLNLYSGLLINYLKNIQKWSDNKESYHFGSPTKNPKIAQQEDSVIKTEKFICNPRESHGISLISKSGLIWDTKKEKANQKEKPTSSF